MIITISGIPSSGKSTIAKMLAQSLGWERRSIGDIIKEMAGTQHINEFYIELEKNPELEKKIDLEQKKWGEEGDNFIIEGRTSFKFMPRDKSYNVFFNLSLEEAAERAYSRYLEQKGNSLNISSKYSSKRDALKKVKERMMVENKRYKQLYGIDHLDMKHYDLVLDASGTKQEVYDSLYGAVLKELERRRTDI